MKSFVYCFGTNSADRLGLWSSGIAVS